MSNIKLSIPVDKFGVFQKELNKFLTRAMRLRDKAENPDSISIPHIVSQTKRVEANGNVGIEYYDIELTPLAQAEGDWDLVAVLPHADANVDDNGVRQIPVQKIGDITPDPEWRHIPDTRCDDCNVRRYRRKAYVLHNRENGEERVVGSTCIDNFLGANSLSLFKLHERFERTLDKVRKFVPNDYRTMSAPKFIETLAEIAGLEGHWETYEETRRHTYYFHQAFRAMKIVMKSFATISHKRNLESASEYQKEQIALYKSKIVPAILWARSLDPKPHEDILQKMKTFSLDQWIDPNNNDNLSVLAGIVPAYLHAMEPEFFKKEETSEPTPVSDDFPTRSNGKFFGRIGERCTTDIKVITIREINSYYGLSDMVKMITKTGEDVVWFTKYEHNLNEGDVVTITGLVKSHNEQYKNTKISRVKIHRD